MNRGRCSECIFYDICDSGDVCEDYAVDDIIDDYTLERNIRLGRLQFYSEWAEYVLDYDEDYFLN